MVCIWMVANYAGGRVWRSGQVYSHWLLARNMMVVLLCCLFFLTWYIAGTYVPSKIDGFQSTWHSGSAYCVVHIPST